MVSRIIKVEVRVSRRRRLRLITVTIELSNSFLIGRKRTMNFRNQRPWRHNCRFFNYHVKETQGHGLSCHVWPQCMISKGNQVKFARFVLLPVSEKAKTRLPFVFVQCIKQLLDSVFVISRIINPLPRVSHLTAPWGERGDLVTCYFDIWGIQGGVLRQLRWALSRYDRH